MTQENVRKVSDEEYEETRIEEWSVEDFLRKAFVSEDKSASHETIIEKVKASINAVCDWWHALSEPDQERTVGPLTHFLDAIAKAFSPQAATKPQDSKGFSERFKSVTADDSDGLDDDEEEDLGNAYK
jgi:hypothetical protein